MKNCALSFVLLLGFLCQPLAAKTVNDVSELMSAGHYDIWVRELAAMAEEGVHAAMARGYYVPIEERARILEQIRTQLAPEKMSSQLAVRMASHSANPSVQSVLRWYRSDVGINTLGSIDKAYAPGASAKQNAIAKALLADPNAAPLWQTLSEQHPFAESWLQQRQSVLTAVVTHMAAVMKPRTPFDSARLQARLETETFELRPKVARQWQLRFIDSVRQLEVTEFVRYRKFAVAGEHQEFLRLVAAESSAVTNQAVAELRAILDVLAVKEEDDQAPVDQNDPELAL